MKIFSYFVIAIVGISIIAGFFILGTPQEERLRRFDQMRISDLQSIQGEIVFFWQSKQKLPKTLNELEDPLRGYQAPKDPETGLDYEYSIKGDKSFSLCANFNLESLSTFVKDAAIDPNSDQPYRAVIPKPVGSNEIWDHLSGKTCFERAIDPEIYRPFPQKGMD